MLGNDIYHKENKTGPGLESAEWQNKWTAVLNKVVRIPR